MRRLWRAAVGLLSPRSPSRMRSSAHIRSERQRESGRPQSTNGASSFHLFWNLPPHDPLVEVSAVLEILTLPAVPDLYFWALQVDFLAGGHSTGAGHAGLQWNRDFPEYTAMNWGGYASPESGGGELEGSTFLLPGMAGSQNTQSYQWQSGRPYRLRVFPSPHITQAWRAEVTDLSSGKATPIRDLYTDGDSLAMPMVWTESFADCAAPPVTVRWSHLRAVDSTGRILTPHSLLVNYQSWEQGGCTNTSVETDARGVLQVTCTPRKLAQGTVLPI